MIAYYLAGLASIALSWLGVTVSRSIKGKDAQPSSSVFPWWVIVLTSVPLIVFSGLRLGVGTDYPMYVRFFEIVDPQSYLNSLQLIPQEAGFVGLMFLVRGVSDDSWFFLLICSALTVLPVLWAVRRASADPVLAVFTYVFLSYYTISLNAVRQSIAVSFVLLADTYRSKGSWGRFVLFSAIAVAFHYSAVIAIVIQVVLTYVDISRRVGILVLVLGAPVGTWVLQQTWARELLVSLNSRYGDYLTEGDAAGTGTVLMALIRIALVVTLMLILSRKGETDSQERRWTSYVLVSAVILLLGSVAMEIARFEPYFGIFLVLLVPAVLKGVKNRWAAVALYAGFALVYFGIHTNAYNGLVPYQTITGMWLF